MVKKNSGSAGTSRSVAERMMALFDGYSRASGTHGVPERDHNGLKWSIKKTARTLNIGPTVEMWQKHLAGERPLGVVCIKDDSTCLWGSIDIDKYNIDLLEVIARVEAAKFPLVPCRSKSGGLHLFMFCSEPVAASTLQLALRNLAAMLGFADSEIFPKQTQILSEQGDSGNWMVMPYYGDTFGGKLKLQHGLKKTGAEMTVEEFLVFAEKAKVSEETIASIRSSSIAEEKPKKGGGSTKRPFGDGPPCLQFMAESGFPDGGRNNALFHIGVYLKRANPGNWKQMLVEDNQKFMKPPLPAEEVVSIQKQLEKKDYEYTCKNQPMSSHCDSITCRTRRFGVGNEAYPEILAMRKLTTEPAVWFVDVMGRDGTVTIRCSSNDLQYFSKFQGLCLEHATTMPREVSPKIWNAIVSEAVDKVEIIEAPPDLSTGGKFKELLQSFLTNRQRGTRKEDLLRDVPWEDEEKGRYYFTIGALEKFLIREKFDMKIQRGELSARIREIHGNHDPKFQPKEFFKIKGLGRNVWWVPSSVIEKAPEIDPPELPKERL